MSLSGTSQNSFYENLFQFYITHLTSVVLPFWEKAIDVQNGGVYTCFTNAGDLLLSKDKYTWSQGRFAWVWSRLSWMCTNGLLTGSPEDYLGLAKGTIDFLNQHAIMDNGNCAFLLTEDGEKKESIPGKGFDTSFFADCFIVLAFEEYARVSKDLQVLDRALRLHDHIVDRLKSDDVRSEPYPIPRGYKAHSVSMIMLNVTQELAETLEGLQHKRTEEFVRASLNYATEILVTFQKGDGRIAELVPKEEGMDQTLLSRYVNPGHAIESMWFVMKTASKYRRNECIEKAGKGLKKAFELGWDQEKGGLFRYVDMNGGKPEGEESHCLYEQMVLETWDMKLWWPHSEALYATLLAYELTGDSEFLALYDRTHNYAFHIFPNPNPEIGEWIQIRDRVGLPVNKIVALPVKDPYHILRDILLIIELLFQRIHPGAL